uniref:acid phosphatase n=1 Tax=Clastoptera arizonana TaxID=38151 RepID=A0A1B6BZM2_9HEMI
MCLLLILFVSALTCVSCFDQYNDTLGTVIFTNVIYRHGDRSPVESYPKDPHKNFSWPSGIGQLTKIGKNQQFELGKWLRRRYDHLLDSNYCRKQIFIASTDVDRTLMSAAANLAGLYPTTDDMKWNQEINWDPIPIHGVPMFSDSVIGATADCPKYIAQIELLRNTQYVKGLMIKYKYLFDYVTVNTGVAINCFMDLFRIYDILYVQYLYNLTLPEWAESVFPEPMGEAALHHFVLPTSNQPLQRLKAGPILGEIVQRFQEKQLGILDPDRTMWMYSAHDTTIANLLNSLNVFDAHIPPYAATVLIELRRKNDEHFVTILYRNNSEHDAQLLTLPNCAPACPLDNFTKIATPLIPSDWDLECQE